MDRDLSVRDLIKLLRAHGCAVEMTPAQYLKARRGSGPDHRHWTQHAHKGGKDSFDRRKVAAARRALGFGGLTDEEFYAPLG